VDQLTKVLVTATVPPGDSLPLVPPALYLTYVQNTGGAFGLFKGRQAWFIILALLIIAWIARELAGRAQMPPRLGWGYALVLGGAIGNLLDRLRLGYVVDFIDLRIWPVFNVGDTAITIGMLVLLWHTLGSRAPRSRPDG
jgi:signal peptidase II